MSVCVWALYPEFQLVVADVFSGTENSWVAAGADSPFLVLGTHLIAAEAQWWL